jgi:hypothetical protein
MDLSVDEFSEKKKVLLKGSMFFVDVLVKTAFQ